MIDSLTSFRFITALIVFIFHCYIHFGFKLDIKFIDVFFKHGAVFMTGFFVLSGFIMTHVYRSWDFSERASIWAFYIKRFAKIYPVYIVATVVFFLFFSQDYTPQQWVRIVVNDLFLVQGFFERMFPFGLNGGTWSLTVEMFLYALFPFILLVSGRSAKILWLAFGLSLLVTLNAIFGKPDYLYANPVMRLADFMAGIGFYTIKDKLLFRRRDVHIGVIVLLIVSTVFLANRDNYMGCQTLTIFLFGAWIACIFHSKHWFYTNKPMVFCGLISYSFYLWQFLAIETGKHLLHLGPTVATLIAFGMNLSLSVLSYSLLEEPARKAILKKSGQWTHIQTGAPGRNRTSI
ncbi:MAG: acyltransferase [Blastochloris viridis]|uniref:Acyltransferase n=1 Tax=Blastochloris viridis TaxID=1079 RepID=A0A6N4RFF2_BLAVI|nr:MAG: acyltransferase [Blastochloris viridis]